MIFWFNDFGPALALALGFLIIASICFHETCHVLAAHWQGDDTAIEHGYLSFNPLKLMGPFSLIVFFLAGIAWGAVPVDPRRFKRSWSDLVVSLAGPAANFFLGTCFSLVYAVMHRNAGTTDHTFALDLVLMGATLNFLLALFNMLPIPPLDGFAVVRHFFPSVSRALATQSWAQILLVLAIFVLFSGKVGGLMYVFAGVITKLMVWLFLQAL